MLTSGEASCPYGQALLLMHDADHTIDLAAWNALQDSGIQQEPSNVAITRRQTHLLLIRF